MVLTGITMAVWLVAGVAACALIPRHALALRRALVAAGIPLLGVVTWQLGPLPGLLSLAAGTGVLALRRAPGWMRAEPAE